MPEKNLPRGRIERLWHLGRLAGGKVTIADAGWPYDGDFLITQVRHHASPGEGFLSDIDFCSDSLPSKS